MMLKPVSFPLKIFNILILLIVIYSNQFPQNNPKCNLDSLFREFIIQRSGQRFQTEENTMVSNPSARREKCGFGLLAAIHSNLEYFSPSQQAAIRQLDSRPLMSQSMISPSGHFKIHYNTTGDSIPSFDPSKSITENVKLIAEAFDSAYSFEVNFLGFLPPPSDGGEGGDKLYDIYIVNFYYLGYYGVTTLEKPIGGNKWTSFIQIDNNFREHPYNTHSFDAAKVTAAHELHHAIQIGSYSYKDDIFFHELTSTAMEDFVFDSIDDYYKGTDIKEYFFNASKSFSSFNGYALAIWDIFLKEKYDFSLIKRQWELYTEYPVLRAINLSLLERHSSFKYELDQFGIWTYFTGYRAVQNMYFKDALHYPVLAYSQRLDYSQSLFPLRLSTQPLSNLFLAILVKSGMRTDTLVIKITDGDLYRALENPLSYLEITYDLFEGQREDSRKITNKYFSKISSSNTDVLLETDFFNDLIAEGEALAFSELDYVYPNPYSYNDFQRIPIALPVAYNDLRTAEIRIFSVGMNLVYSGTGVIFDDKYRKKYFVNWNGLDSRDSRLPTGVYIYVTSSNGEVKKGKLVIKN